MEVVKSFKRWGPVGGDQVLRGIDVFVMEYMLPLTGSSQESSTPFSMVLLATLECSPTIFMHLL